MSDDWFKPIGDTKPLPTLAMPLKTDLKSLRSHFHYREGLYDQDEVERRREAKKTEKLMSQGGLQSAYPPKKAFKPDQKQPTLNELRLKSST